MVRKFHKSDMFTILLKTVTFGFFQVSNKIVNTHRKNGLIFFYKQKVYSGRNSFSLFRVTGFFLYPLMFLGGIERDQWY